MRSFSSCRLWTLVLGLPLAACGSSAGSGLYGSTGDDPGPDRGADPGSASASTQKASAPPVAFPGGGTSGAAQPLAAALAPESSGECNPEPSAAVVTEASVQTVCFYGADEPDVPAAIIEQIVEVVGTEEWVHMRLTLNPDFVDNTYGETAIGWGEAAAAPDAPAPPDATPDATPPAPADRPAPPDAREAPPPPEAEGPPDAPGLPAPPPDGPGAEPPDGPGAEPPDGPGAEPPDGPDAGPPRERPEPPPDRERPRAGRGHSFRDLLGSDHAEIQMLDAAGTVAMHFRIDYLSESGSAPSGFASLGVSGGEGESFIGEPEWVLATTTSLDRNINACGLSSFTESSPATDAAYTPVPGATDWDYRVAYEVWVSTDAFGAAGFGSALIENVHASPSKLDGDTVDVHPAPCPVDPGTPEAELEPLPPVLRDIR